MMKNLNNLINQNMYLFILYMFLMMMLMFLMLTDDSFILNSKMMMMMMNILFLLLSLYMSKTPMLMMKDLFWYSVCMNMSFMVHVLMLDRMFYWAWKKSSTKNKNKKMKMEYLGFLASSMSFTFSIWGLIYFFSMMMDDYILMYFYDMDSDGDKNSHMSLHKKNVSFMILMEDLMSVMLMHFSMVFHNYSSMLMGKNEKFEWKMYLMIMMNFIMFYMNINNNMNIKIMYNLNVSWNNGIM